MLDITDDEVVKLLKAHAKEVKDNIDVFGIGASIEYNAERINTLSLELRHRGYPRIGDFHEPAPIHV